jgi:hypothetical protein
VCASTIVGASDELQELVDGLLLRLPVLAQELAARLADKEPFYRRVYEFAPARFHEVCGDAVREALIAVAEDHSGEPVTARKAALDHVRVGASLAAMLSALRVFGSFVHDVALRQLADQGDGSPFAVVQLSTRIWRIVDAYSELATAVYRDAGTEAVRRDGRARLAALDGLLNGRVAPDFELDETARVLGLPLSGAFLLAMVDHDDAHSVAALADIRQWRSAWRPGPDVEVGIIVADRISDLTAIRQTLSGVPIAIGLSAVFTDLADAATAARQARIARRCLSADAVGLVQYGVMPLANLLAAAPVQAADHARALLAGVLHGPSSEREVLLSTLRAWYDGRGVAKEVGRQLFLHPNTIRYRLRRVQELTGLDLTNPRDVAELYVALEAVRLSAAGDGQLG